MEETLEAVPTIYALEPVDGLCARCRDHAKMRVIVLPPAVAQARAQKPVHASAFRRVSEETNEFAHATWEDAEWQ